MASRGRIEDWPVGRILLALFILVVTCTLLPVTLLNVWNTGSLILDRGLERELLVARRTADRIEDYFDSLLNWGQDFSNRPALRTWLEAGDYSDPAMRSRWEHEILLPFQNRKRLAGTFVATPRGEIILRSGRPVFPRPLPSWQVLQEAGRGREAISDVFFDPAGKTPYLAVVVPIRSPAEHRVVAVVGVVDTLSNLRTLVETDTGTIGPGSFAILANENWVPLVHGTTPDLEGIPHPASELMENLQRLRKDPEARPFVHHYQPSTREWGYGAQVLLTTKPWVYYVGTPDSYFLAPGWRQVGMNAVAFLIMLFLAAGLSRVLANWFSRPILRLQEAAVAWEHGNLAARVEVSGHNELGLLSVAFNRMADQVQGYAEGLERMVRERTRQLGVAEERLRNVVTNTPLILFAIDGDGLVTIAEGRGLAAMGRQAGEGVGKSVVEVFKETPQLLENYRRARSGETFRTVIELGGLVFETWFSPIRGTEEEGIGVIGVASDITDRKRLEEALRAQYEQLKELDRIKTNFVNAISHDLRTPLTSIMGFSEFLEDGIGGDLAPEQMQYVRQIQMATKRLDRLVNDLLDFSRIQAGTFRLRLEEDDLGLKIREIIESMRPQIEGARLEVAETLPQEPLVLRMDPQRVGQVITNLLHNALKFTPEGGCIRIRAWIEGGRFRCEVEDTGIGIAPEDIPKLFKQFSQLESGKQKGGTGLGLSICKTIVEAHGGQIGVISAPGRGSTFWFTLPLGSAEAPRVP